jgi:transposase InsO family protein
MAVARRWPAAGLDYDAGARRDVALALGGRCRAAGVDASRAARPSTLDRAVAEGFFALLRRELLDTQPWPTRTEADFAVSDWIDSYNLRALHGLGGNSEPRSRFRVADRDSAGGHAEESAEP